jgi:hypothetical protein
MYIKVTRSMQFQTISDSIMTKKGGQQLPATGKDNQSG